MNEIICNTQDVTQLTDQIYRIRVAPQTGQLFDFKGGQYLFLLMPDGKRIPLSIASAPQQTGFIELHIRIMTNECLAAEMLALFQSKQQYSIEGPHGNCFLRDGNNDVVLIAGGTGFSPMKSLLESALAENTIRKFSIYLGAQTSAELYQTPLLAELQNNGHVFDYVPVIGATEDNWAGAIGFPHEIALERLGDNAKSCDFFISGSEMMVMNVYQSLLAAGVPKSNVYSDILDIKRDLGQLD